MCRARLSMNTRRDRHLRRPSPHPKSIVLSCSSANRHMRNWQSAPKSGFEGYRFESGSVISSARVRASSARSRQCGDQHRLAPSGIRSPVWPSTKPVPFKPSRNAAKSCSAPSGDVLRRNPIAGIAGCCARAVSGHAAGSHVSPIRSIFSSGRREPRHQSQQYQNTSRRSVRQTLR
jgi:hypothetical protein